MHGFAEVILGDVGELRLPLRIGAGLIIGSDGEPLLFTEKQAKRRAEKSDKHALTAYGFEMFFGRTNPELLGIAKDPCWYAEWGKKC